MAINVENKFTIEQDKSGKLFTMTRVLSDEYTLIECKKLLEDTFDYYVYMKGYVEHFEALINQETDKWKAEGKTDESIQKLISMRENQYKIDRDIELPKLEREMDSYISLAKQINFPIPEEGFEKFNFEDVKDMIIHQED